VLGQLGLQVSAGRVIQALARRVAARKESAGHVDPAVACSTHE
jgi:hypothetical protein